ncbi:MAG: aminotransferase, partial [Candidatus Poseidoniaceae archaeon]
MVARSTSPLAAHWDLDPQVSYLNHGSFGATPRAVIEEQRRWQTKLETNPMAFLESEVYTAMKAAREALAQMLSCD